MSCTIKDSVKLGLVFQCTECVGIDGHFEKKRLELLSVEDRKICFGALTQLEKADLNDWKKSEPKDKIDGDRIRKIGDQLRAPAASTVDVKDPWYLVPFMWIAKRVDAIFDWFKDTFLGGVSANKLHDKVAAYRQDWAQGRKRHEEIHSQGFKERTLAIDKAEVEYRGIQSRMTSSIQESRNILNRIRDKYQNAKDFSNPMPLSVIVKQELDNVAPFDLFKELNEISKESATTKAEAGKQEDRLLRAFNVAYEISENGITDFIEAELKPKEDELKRVEDELQNLKKEALLLAKKFDLQTSKDLSMATIDGE